MVKSIISDLLSIKESEFFIFRLYTNDILHVTVKSGVKISKKELEEGYQFVEENGGGKFYNIFEFQPFAEIDPEVRLWAASPENNENSIADALVVTTLSLKMIADFYINNYNPVVPTKIFNNVYDAIIWIESLKNQPTN